MPKRALDGGGTVLHVDVMDGHFVPEYHNWALVVRRCEKALPNAVLDCHLMIEKSDTTSALRSGASWISCTRSCVHLHRTLQLIIRTGANPAWC